MDEDTVICALVASAEGFAFSPDGRGKALAKAGGKTFRITVEEV